MLVAAEPELFFSFFYFYIFDLTMQHAGSVPDHGSILTPGKMEAPNFNHWTTREPPEHLC